MRHGITIYDTDFTKIMPSILIAGTHSGVGKTTVAMALMAAFSR
ncbi:hypothetical protein DRN77_03410, partial [Methanosarcinales archaeon]